MSKKHFLLSVAALVAFLIASLVLPMVPILYTDPLHILKSYDDEENYFYHNLRWTLPGVIKHHFEDKRDTRNILLGSSVTLDGTPEDMEKLAGMPNALTLSLLSIQADELNTIATVLNRYDSIENIIFSFDSGQYFRYGSTRNHDFPTDLYTGSLTDKIKSMRNMDIMKFAWNIMQGTAEKTTYEQLRISMPKRCANRLFTKFQTEEFETLVATAEEARERLRNTQPGEIEVDVNEFIAGQQVIKTLRSIPETVRVHVFLSPALVNQGFNSTEMPFYRAGILDLLEKFADKPNITLYGFDDVPEIVNNVSNYLDATHYGIGVMRYILKSVGEKKHVITRENVEQYLERAYHNRLTAAPYIDNEHTMAFEGPLDEELFSQYPPPHGPSPFPLP